VAGKADMGIKKTLGKERVPKLPSRNTGPREGRGNAQGIDNLKEYCTFE